MRLNIAIIRLLAVWFVLIISNTDALAQTPPLWGGLTPGPYAVGFKTIEKYDYSRAILPKYDYFGTPMDNETARPIQICIWYPTPGAEDAIPMVLGEYVFPNPEDGEFFRYVSQLQQRELGFLGGLLGNNGLVLDVVNVETGAVRNATPAEGAFPLLLYFPDIRHAFSDNLVMCEFLASQGYVIVSVSFVGPADFVPGEPGANLEALIADMAFALASVRDEPYIDQSKVGVFGIGFGGAAAMLLQMRDYRVNAVAGLAGAGIMAESLKLVMANPFYSARRMMVPNLQIYSKDDTLYDLSLIDSCRYSNRHLVELEQAPSQGFTSYGAVVDIISEDGILGASVNHPVYDVASLYLLNFFNAYLNNNENSMKSLKAGLDGEQLGVGTITYTEKAAEEIPPTTNQFLSIIRSHGAARAIELYDKFSKIDPGGIIVPEGTMNILGYQTLQRGQLEEAVALFRINTETYPNSLNVWDSYSDGLQAIGDNEKAMECYRKVLELLANDTQTDPGLKETLRLNAEQGLERLKSGN